MPALPWGVGVAALEGCSMSEARPTLQAAVRRLMQAIAKPEVEVTVHRQDLEILLCTWRPKQVP
jgi:hypothetical protein